MTNPFLEEARELSPELREIFCQLHRNPELGRREHQTQALILQKLNRLGIEAAPIADTGVLGLIRGGKPGKTVALRADMDALPVQEDINLPYRSQAPGVMHACGHDAHVTVLLGAAALLVRHKEELQGNVKLFFQPDEEGEGGAERMIWAGCMEDPHVDAVFFGHSSPSLPVGTLSVRAGAASAASNPFVITFRGKGTHGAHPEEGSDVIVAACQAVVALQTIASRRTSPTDSVVLSVGAIHAGTSDNILPETATIRGMMRTLSPQTRARAKMDLQQIVSGVAAAMGVEVEIDLRDGYMATINDETAAQLVRCAAEKVLGREQVRTTPTPALTTEDFGYFCQAAPGCYYNLGVADPNKDGAEPLHNPRFAVNPGALPYGAALYAQIARDFLTNE